MTIHPADLERLVDRELRALPMPQAPQTLVPRVLAAVRASVRRPRTWFGWPLAWQVVSVAALMFLVAGIVTLLPEAQAAVGPLFANLNGATTTRTADIVARVNVMTTAAGVMWRVFIQPIVGYVFALVVVMSAGCAAFGALLGRVALGGASHS